MMGLLVLSLAFYGSLANRRPPLPQNATVPLLESARNDPLMFLAGQMGVGSLAVQHQIVEKEAFNKLINGMIRDLRDTVAGVDLLPFQDLAVSLPIADRLAHLSDGLGDTEKYFVAEDAIRRIGKRYVIYAAGIAGHPGFENQMAGLGATVVAFDCTDEKKDTYHFDFHPWCIGTPHSFEGSLYAAGKDSGQQFYSLQQIKKKLGHPSVQMLKMDIEGSEWELLQKEIVDADEGSLPEQLLFELHTEGANPQVVPPSIVHGKRRQAVNRLVFDLW
ncbi:hypothetical protein B484DRAFT_459708 [Ochromonadaceae sp. CCMP2298]|nr:hypothetical protein B484DRAFT_459708 [Ochromonadaceae sp. CCMP2298]